MIDEQKIREIVQDELQKADASTADEQDSGGYSRRNILQGAGLFGFGSLAATAVGRGGIGQASANNGDALYGIDQIGLPDDRVETLYVDEVDSVLEAGTLDGDLDADGYDIQNAGSVSTEEADVDEALVSLLRDGEARVDRREVYAIELTGQGGFDETIDVPLSDGVTTIVRAKDIDDETGNVEIRLQWGDRQSDRYTFLHRNEQGETDREDNATSWALLTHHDGDRNVTSGEWTIRQTNDAAEISGSGYDMFGEEHEALTAGGLSGTKEEDEIRLVTNNDPSSDSDFSWEFQILIVDGGLGN
ncbi:hypothetical protein OB905_13190 [Halobacteria archaeon AArc-dxtr1]|nr:hypothetical protein [Halobacteria archaeon AArc-dxtr1]